jgi:hypothetical protein
MICISSDDAGDSTHQLDFMTWKWWAGRARRLPAVMVSNRSFQYRLIARRAAIDKEVLDET